VVYIFSYTIVSKSSLKKAQESDLLLGVAFGRCRGRVGGHSRPPSRTRNGTLNIIYNHPRPRQTKRQMGTPQHGNPAGGNCGGKFWPFRCVPSLSFESVLAAPLTSELDSDSESVDDS